MHFKFQGNKLFLLGLEFGTLIKALSLELSLIIRIKALGVMFRKFFFFLSF